MRLTCFAAIVIFAAGCASPAEPHTSDVAFAHAQWLGFHPASYSFDLSMASSMLSSPGATHITVVNGQMTSARGPSGAPLQNPVVFTIDTLWARTLSAWQNGTLNSAEFTMAGVPTDVDMGPWPVDGGVHYTIRNFAVVH